MRKIFVLFSIFALLLTACSADDSATPNNQPTENQLSVYTTVYPLQYFTERIGGEFVQVSSIYPVGANEHTFEPTQKDMMALADADLFFYIGLGLEGFVENAQKSLSKEDVKFVATAKNVTEEQLDISTGHQHEEGEGDEDHGHHEIDAHVWLSPIISQELARSIKNELVAALPEQEAVFNKNYEQLVGELNDLNSELESKAAATSKKTFFVSHAAFGYLAGHYGLTQVPVAGLNSQSEPSQKELTAIVDLAKQENIHYIFFEQNVSSNLTKIIQKELGAETLILHNLSVLTKEDVANNENYFTLMRKNMDALTKALSH
ncbi:adhesin [Solibacillus sp. R5-41]|uniref:metal ABC transporter solute-binding protein, Zn/Mn family n=1 Tax=Solibacillus sp. R5-41 TaxID=2048654 RepID=UPI000C12973B|nr:zinc ABC transporter substrate-binding protein [Solibacillus sp. R5-41]ATP41529.1 adhesin [Solibacillus sp. R5-41]